MKYKLTDEKISWNGRTLYRKQPLKDFGNVKAGDLGGWVQNEINLSQEGDCWIYDNAKVFGRAVVQDSAIVKGSAVVSASAVVKDLAEVYGSAIVSDSAVVSGRAVVQDSAVVYGSAKVYGSAVVRDSAVVRASAEVTKDTVNLNVYYNITITDEHIIIGCQCHTYKKWLDFTDKEIAEMDDTALDGMDDTALKWWKQYKDIVLGIFRNERGVK